MQQIHILQATEVRILHCNVSGKSVDVGDALDLGRVGVHELSNILERPDFKFLEVYAGLVKEWLTCTFGPASASAAPHSAVSIVTSFGRDALNWPPRRADVAGARSRGHLARNLHRRS